MESTRVNRRAFLGGAAAASLSASVFPAVLRAQPRTVKVGMVEPLTGPMADVLDRVRAGEEDPPCLVCGGILKSDTISFGQPLVPEVIERAMRAAGEAEVLLAVGSTLQVLPAAGVVPAAHAAGAHIVIINNQPTPMDSLAEVLLRGPIGELLPQLCE